MFFPLFFPASWPVLTFSVSWLQQNKNKGAAELNQDWLLFVAHCFFCVGSPSAVLRNTSWLQMANPASCYQTSVRAPSASNRMQNSTTLSLGKCCMATTTEPNMSTKGRFSRWHSGTCCHIPSFPFSRVEQICKFRFLCSESCICNIMCLHMGLGTPVHLLVFERHCGSLASVPKPKYCLECWKNFARNSRLRRVTSFAELFCSLWHKRGLGMEC